MRLLSGLIIFIITASQLAAQPSEKVIVDLNKAISIAIENNYDLKTGRLNKDIAYEKVEETWGTAVYPELKGSVNYRRALKKGVFTIDAPGFSGTFPIGTDNTLTATLSLSQNIFAGGIFIGAQAAEIYAKIADHIVDATELELKYQVKAAYFGVMVTKEVLEVASANLSQAEDNLKNTQIKYDAGLVPEYDLVRAKVAVQTAKPELEQAKNSNQITRDVLRNIMGLSYNVEVEVSDSLNYKDLTIDEFELVVEKMFRFNPVVKQLEQTINLREKAVGVYQSEFLPSLRAYGAWNVESQENDERSIGSWRFNNSINLGLELSVPIFNGWSSKSRVTQAELEVKIARENLKKTKEGLATQLRETTLKIANQKEKLKAYTEAVSQAELAHSLANIRYTAGVGTQLEVIDAQVGVTRAKYNYLNGVYEYYLLIANLEKLSGKESGE
ncbi:MAG: TolC family protein [Ignavibacteriales bacterium]|jgi:outer membrane protein|nr:TolC family protein [Ignavibacteriales bacterium]MBK7265230.1 TolC family protein [Ignavibacteriales bacterium]MBP9123600.1 TolC family protein [Ignavibacteriaceae bacterium]MCC6636528.1 TolC family protein [Ignavibacteriaceae bacterium]